MKHKVWCPWLRTGRCCCEPPVVHRDRFYWLLCVIVALAAFDILWIFTH